MKPEKKNKILLIATIVICLAIIGTGTLAYYTDQQIAHNVVTSGEVDITLLEWADEAKTQPFENLSGVMPGSQVTKIVEVKNVGVSDAWVRVQVLCSDDELMTLDYDGESYNEASWDKVGGFYYYNKILKPGQTTAPLFEEVAFSSGMGNEYQSSSFTINIVAEAVQSKNNIPTSGDAWDAGGWTVIQPLIRRIMY